MSRKKQLTKKEKFPSLLGSVSKGVGLSLSLSLSFINSLIVDEDDEAVAACDATRVERLLLLCLPRGEVAPKPRAGRLLYHPRVV